MRVANGVDVLSGGRCTIGRTVRQRRAESGSCATLSAYWGLEHFARKATPWVQFPRQLLVHASSQIPLEQILCKKILVLLFECFKPFPGARYKKWKSRDSSEKKRRSQWHARCHRSIELLQLDFGVIRPKPQCRRVFKVLVEIFNQHY